VVSESVVKAKDTCGAMCTYGRGRVAGQVDLSTNQSLQSHFITKSFC